MPGQFSGDSADAEGQGGDGSLSGSGQGITGVGAAGQNSAGQNGVADGGNGGAGAADADAVGSTKGKRKGARLAGRNGRRGAGGDASGNGENSAGADGDDESADGSVAGADGDDESGGGSAMGASGAASGRLGAEGGDTRLASVTSPSSGVTVDEDREPQTLGGALPLVIGVNEEGRFDFDEYTLRPEVQSILDDLAEKLKGANYDRLDIAGYTDRIGGVDYNQRLSELRAYTVARYLTSKGVPENKIHYAGRGSQNPLTPPGECVGLDRDSLIPCLQRDRRVEIEASIHRKRATVLR
jgi:outer membrane protein OmpA-like peptidoglycan-associated protein